MLTYQRLKEPTEVNRELIDSNAAPTITWSKRAKKVNRRFLQEDVHVAAGVGKLFYVSAGTYL